MLELKKFLKKNLLFIVLGISVLTVYFFITVSDSDAEFKIDSVEEIPINLEKEPTDQKGRNTGKAQENRIYIDLKGAVRYPGVYEMQSGTRVKDVLAKAGGLTEVADPLMINLAQVLEDEMVLYVPMKGEDVAAITSGGVVTTQDDGLLNINKATATDLETLDGIGPAKAEAIIAYRTEKGNFSNIEELKEVSGIGEGVFSKIKDKITIK